MTEPSLPYTVVDGIKCYSSSVAADYTDYPESGFDLTNKIAESSFWVTSRNRLFKGLVEKHLKPNGKTALLEVGCGTGDFIRTLVESDKLKITGSEVYLKGLMQAKKSFPHIEFVQFDVSQGAIGIEFDMICAFDVIEHINDDTKALSNIYRMLKPNGVVLLSVPQHMFLWSHLDELVKHKRRYSKRELRAKLKESGFHVSRTTSFVFALFPLMVFSRLFDKGATSSRADERELERRVTFSHFANAVFDFVMRIDEWLIRSGLSLPFGGTLVAVARKPE
jgi:2-polyprenyl-3-methyl-5-hydroxy-6-metoxy-1,4-benzoquinol methylase